MVPVWVFSTLVARAALTVLDEQQVVEMHTSTPDPPSISRQSFLEYTSVPCTSGFECELGSFNCDFTSIARHAKTQRQFRLLHNAIRTVSFAFH